MSSPSLRQLHDATEIHDRDPVGEVAGAREVVGDVQVRDAPRLLEVAQQPQDLRPAGGIDHRYRLVGDDIGRLHDHRPRDVDPLPLATRQRVGIPVEQVRGRSQSHLLERLHDPVAALRGRPDAVDHERLGHDVEHPHVGAEAGVGILEHRLGAPPEGLELVVRQVGDVHALERHPSRGQRAPGAGTRARAWSCRCRTPPPRPASRRAPATPTRPGGW